MLTQKNILRFLKTSGFDIAAGVHLVQYALNITALKEYLNTVGQVRTVLEFFDGFVKMVRNDTYDKSIFYV